MQDPGSASAHPLVATAALNCRYILIIPTKQLVIVRLAFNSGDDDSDALAGPFLGAAAAAVKDAEQILTEQVSA